ncbi:uncharacterized protein V3H82_010004 [Fundulus diaphanus]
MTFCVDSIVPTRRLRCFANNPPWVTPELKVLLNQKKRAFYSGDREEQRRVQRELQWRIRAAKKDYGKKMEEQLAKNNVRDVWRGLKNISGFGQRTSRAADVMFFDFSSAFNTIRPVLLREKLEDAGVDKHLADWTIDYLTNRPQHVRLHGCQSEVALCSTGAPQGTVLSPFLFTLYTSDFTYNTDSCHLQKFSDDSV